MTEENTYTWRRKEREWRKVGKKEKERLSDRQREQGEGETKSAMERRKIKEREEIPIFNRNP